MAITVAMRTEISQLYVALFGRAPDGEGLGFWTTLRDQGQSLTQIANTMFATTPARAIYPSFLTNGEIISSFYVNVLGRTADAEGLAFWTAKLNAAGATPGTVIAEMINVVANYTGTDPAGLTSQALYNNKVSVAQYYGEKNGSIAGASTVLGTVTSAAASVATTKAAIDSGTVGGINQGQTYTLTANSDVLGPDSQTAATKTTTGNDTIFANADGSLSGSDVIDAGAGVDTLFSVQDTTTDESLTPVLTSVEKVYIDVNDGTTGTANTYTFNGATSTGLTEVWANAFSGSTTTKEDTFAITGVGTGVATGIKGGDGEFHVTTTYNSVTGTADSATLALEAANVDTVTMAGIETINVSIAGAASTTAGASTIATLTATSLGALNITGARNLTITNNVDFKDATDTLANDGVVTATGMTGNLTLALGTTGDNVKFTGGSGKNAITTGGGNDTLTGGAAADTFTVGTGNDTVDGGAGDDRVVVAVAAIDGSDTFTLGEGTRDALILDTTTLNVTGVDATLLGRINGTKITGVEVIGSNGAVTAIDAGYFNQTVYEATANLTAALTVSNVAGDTLVLSGNGITGVNGDSLTVTGALPNQAFTLELNGANAVTLAATDGGAGNNALAIASGVSTVNLVSSTTNTTPSGVTNLIQNAAATTATHTIDNASAGSFVLTGAVNLTIASGKDAGFTKAVDFNATAFTGKLSIVGSTEADVIKGGTAADTLNGDDGDDVLTGGAGADTFVFLTADTSGAPTASVLETITDWAKGSDIIDWSTALTVDTAAATAVATVAQVNAEGIATFHADDDTFAERLVASTKGMDAAGDFVVFEHGGNTYVYLSGDANATQDAADTLVKLTGVTGISDSTIDGNGNMLLA